MEMQKHIQSALCGQNKTATKMIFFASWVYGITMSICNSMCTKLNICTSISKPIPNPIP